MCLDIYIIHSAVSEHEPTQHITMNFALTSVASVCTTINTEDYMYLYVVDDTNLLSAGHVTSWQWWRRWACRRWPWRRAEWRTWGGRWDRSRAAPARRPCTRRASRTARTSRWTDRAAPGRCTAAKQKHSVTGFSVLASKQRCVLIAIKKRKDQIDICGLDFTTKVSCWEKPEWLIYYGVYCMTIPSHTRRPRIRMLVSRVAFPGRTLTIWHHSD